MKPQVVSFRCVLRDSIGHVISTTISQGVMTHPSQPAPHSLPGLARRMKNLRKGEKRRIALDAHEAYGLYDPSLVVEAPRREFSAVQGLGVGNQVYAHDADGKLRPFRVTEITSNKVVLDANHPLAGQDLTFDIEVTDARYATREEILESSDGPKPDRWVH